MLAALCEALAEDDRLPLEDHLHTLGVDTDALWQLPRWNAHERGTGAHRAGESDAQRCEAALDVACRQVAATDPLGPALLGLYVWHLCSDAWEDTYRFGRISATLDAFTAACRRAVPAGSAQAVAAEAACCLTRLLAVQLETENALCSGDLARHRTAAQASTAAAVELVARADGLAEALAPLADLLRAVGAENVTYYTAMTRAVDAATRLLAGDPAPVAVAVADLHAAEEHFDAAQIVRGELRAYRFALERLQSAAEQTWVHVDHARVTYLYPFGLSCDPEDAADAVRALAGRPSLGGVEARTVRHSFEIDDVWAGSDFLARRFEGAAIELPAVELFACDPARPGSVDPALRLARLDAEVRVSSLGNHYLRLADESVTDAGPHQVAEILLRAATEHGPLTVVCGRRRFERLPDLAAAVRDDVARLLSGPGTPAVASEGRFHVLLSVTDASGGRGPAAPPRERTPFTAGEDLLTAFGAQALAHAVPNGVAAVCDWARFAVEDDAAIHDVRWSGGLVVPTANTTLSVLLGTPPFMVTDHEVVAEFVGSLDGMFAGWYRDLARHYEQLDAVLTEDETGMDLAALTSYADRLRATQRELYDFAARTRSTLTLVHSPNLMESPADGRHLAALLAAGDVERRGQDFSAKLAELVDGRIEARLDTIAALARDEAGRLQQEHERRSESVIQGLLGAIAVFGVAGLFQVLQGADAAGGRAIWAEVFTGLCFVVAVGLGFVIHHLYVRRRR